jgi:hypothetical protein
MARSANAAFITIKIGCTDPGLQQLRARCKQFEQKQGTKHVLP